MQLNSLGLQNTALDGVFLMHSPRTSDVRGTVQTGFTAPHYAAFGLNTRYVADTYTHTTQGSLYGLYYARDNQMSQLFTAVRGSVFVVAVDLRPRRKTFGQAISFVLNDQMPQCYFAQGIAWGFTCLSETADIHQKFAALPIAEQMDGILWNDPELNVQWPFQRPVVGPDDAQFASLEQTLAKLNVVPVREVVIR